jgi:surface polysaccharide O-acyltransferase-like enzyme
MEQASHDPGHISTQHRVDVVPPTPSGRPREYAVDLLRAGAILLVVTLHSALAYIRQEVPALVWAVHDPAGTSRAFDLFCWWSMSVSNAMFFLISGFLAAGIWDSRGPVGFWVNRGRRVVLPFLAGMTVVAPLSLYAWYYGWLVMGRATPSEIMRWRFSYPGFQQNLWGPGHLWFLYYLIMMLGVFTCVRLVGRPWRVFEGALGRLGASGPGVLVLGLVSTCFLGAHLKFFGIDAALDRHNSLVPDPLRVGHYFLFFLVGVGLRGIPGALAGLWPRSAWLLALSLPVFATRAYLLSRDWVQPLPLPARVVMTVLGGYFSWLTVLGLLGTATRYVRAPIRAVRYLADGSFWIYLIHMPLVGVLQADLYGVPISPVFKVALVWVITMGIGVGSYQTMVRHTFIGRFLHGERPRWSEIPGAVPHLQPNRAAVATDVAHPHRG